MARNFFNKKNLTISLFIIALLSSIPIFLFYKNKPLNFEKSKLQNETFENSEEFILIGDTGTGSEAQYQVAGAIRNYCATNNCQAGFILGDVIYDKGVESVSDKQFKTKFEDPYKDLAFPFYIALGNHDYQGCIECYFEYSRQSNKWKIPSSYYFKSFENVTFYVIDTEKFGSEQANWLKNKLYEDKKKWKIVLGHRPLKTFEKTKINEKWAGDDILKEALCGSANYYVSGHSHILEFPERIGSCKVFQFVSGGGGAQIREVSKPYKGVFYSENNGFLALSVTNEAIYFHFYNTNSELLYTFTNPIRIKPN